MALSPRASRFLLVCLLSCSQAYFCYSSWKCGRRNHLCLNLKNSNDKGRACDSESPQASLGEFTRLKIRPYHSLFTLRNFIHLQFYVLRYCSQSWVKIHRRPLWQPLLAKSMGVEADVVISTTLPSITTVFFWLKLHIVEGYQLLMLRSLVCLVASMTRVNRQAAHPRLKG